MAREEILALANNGAVRPGAATTALRSTAVLPKCSLCATRPTGIAGFFAAMANSKGALAQKVAVLFLPSCVAKTSPYPSGYDLVFASCLAKKLLATPCHLLMRQALKGNRLIALSL